MKCFIFLFSVIISFLNQSHAQLSCAEILHSHGSDSRVPASRLLNLSDARSLTQRLQETAEEIFDTQSTDENAEKYFNSYLSLRLASLPYRLRKRVSGLIEEALELSPPYLSGQAFSSQLALAGITRNRTSFSFVASTSYMYTLIDYANQIYLIERYIQMITGLSQPPTSPYPFYRFRRNRDFNSSYRSQRERSARLLQAAFWLGVPRQLRIELTEHIKDNQNLNPRIQRILLDSIESFESTNIQP